MAGTRLHENWCYDLLMKSGFILLLAGLLFLAGTASADDGCTAAQCHASIVKGKSVHAATEDCTACHESIASPHPQKGKATFKLAQDPPDLCYNCHDAFGKKKDLHPPVKEGMCTTCHNPHASDQPKLLTQPAGELCKSCHEEQTKFKNLHGPVSAGDCTACHLPHESDTAKLLIKEGEALCIGCHTDMEAIRKKKDIHPALDSGCTTCHNPHGSEHAKLLVSEGKELCFQCHSEISDTLQAAAVVHAPVTTEAACASCHTPHASDHPKLLPKEGAAFCQDCHKTIITKDMTFLHKPIQDGTCTPCHNPHGSKNEKLLMKEFPAAEYASYTDKEYELCFSCHKRELLQFPDTSFATNFRDGERNLHYLHVNKSEKGRTCRMCHNVHGSNNPVLIAASIPFGKWSLPLNYEKTETGGSCAPGCHKPQSYDRKNPGKKPERTKPSQ